MAMPGCLRHITRSLEGGLAGLGGMGRGRTGGGGTWSRWVCSGCMRVVWRELWEVEVAVVKVAGK